MFNRLTALKLAISAIRIKQWREINVTLINLLNVGNNDLMSAVANEHIGFAKKDNLSIRQIRGSFFMVPIAQTKPISSRLAPSAQVGYGLVLSAQHIHRKLTALSGKILLLGYQLIDTHK